VAFGLDYGDPVGHAIGAYTALKTADLQQQEFEHRKTIEDQSAQQRQEAHDQATTTFNNARLANEGAGIQAEMRVYQQQGQPIPDDLITRATQHLGNAGIKMALAHSAGPPTPDLVDKAFATGTVPKEYLDPKFTDQRKAEIDKAMMAFGDVVGQQRPAQQQAISNPIQGADGPQSPFPQAAPAPQAVNTDPSASAPPAPGPQAAITPPSAVGFGDEPASPAASPAPSGSYASQAVAKNQLLTSMTDLFKGDLLAGKLDDGQAPKDARIVDMHPSPDGKAIALEVQFTRQDGSTYNAPLTENRSAHPNDPVKFLPVEDMVNHITAERALIAGIDAARAKYGDKEVISRMDSVSTAAQVREASAARNEPIAKAYEAQAVELQAEGDKYNAGRLSGLATMLRQGMDPKEVSEMEKNGVRPPKFTAIPKVGAINNNTGELVSAPADTGFNAQVVRAPAGAKDATGNLIAKGTPVNMRTIGGKDVYAPAVLADTTGGSKASKLPADAQMVEYMVSNGIAPTKKAAYDMVKHTKENPQAMVLKLAHDAIHARDSQYIQPGSKDYKTDEEIITDATTLVGKMNAMQTPTAIQPAAEHATVPMKKAPASAVQQAANNSYSKQAAIGILKGLGYTHDETGKPL
jgi:hypothetical protein